MEYYNLKLENRNNYLSSYYTDSLAIMICDYYQFDEVTSLRIVKDYIQNTKSPIELLRIIQKSIQLKTE